MNTPNFPNPYLGIYVFVYYSFGMEKVMEITQQGANTERWSPVVMSMDFGVKFSTFKSWLCNVFSCVTLEKITKFFYASISSSVKGRQR